VREGTLKAERPLDIQLWLFYFASAIGLSLTPGPNGLLVLTHGMRFGWRQTLPTALGGVAGFMVLIAASLAGLGALLTTSERAFEVARWIGAAYLVYLGIRTWRAPPPVVAQALPADPQRPAHGGDALGPGSSSGATRDSSDTVDAAWRQRLSEGFIVAISNPKALIFFAAFLPQFMQPGVPLWLQFLILGGTFGLIELVYEVLVARAAQQIAPWLGRHGRWFNRFAGATFVAIGGVLALARR
jgi:homoserine/homoserine lactone efflux protein